MANAHLDNIASYARSIEAEVPLAQADMDSSHPSSPPGMWCDLQNAPNQPNQPQIWHQINDSGTPQGNLGTMSWPVDGLMHMNWTPQVVTFANWRNVYMYRTLRVTAPPYLMYPSIFTVADPAGLNLREKEIHCVRGGQVYNGGLQYGKTLKVFDYYGKKSGTNPNPWVDTGIPVPDPLPGIAIRVVAQYQLTDVMTFVSVAINGKLSPINKSFKTWPEPGPDHINVAWQLDGANKPIPISASFRCDLFGCQ